jgi:lipooligosaccharide transport system permease protein
MLFFSGVFFPLDKFPQWLKVLALFMPLTHAVNISRAAYSGEMAPGIAWNILVLCVLEAIAFVVGIKLMKRRLIS